MKNETDFGVSAAYKTVIDIPPSALNGVTPIVPFSDALKDRTNKARHGIIRHGGLGRPDNHVPSEYKPSYSIHLREFYSSLSDEIRKRARTVILVGARNVMQNLLQPCFVNGSLLSRVDEPLESQIYCALCSVAERLVIQKVRFVRLASGEVVPEGELSGQIEWAICAVPLLYRSGLPSPSLQAAMSYDLRHCFHILYEDWQVSKFGSAAHREAHDQLMACFMDRLSWDVNERAAGLAEIVARFGLASERGYLHSSLGLRSDGSVVWLAMSGSLSDLGLELRGLGCDSGVLLDNGGSVAAACFGSKKCDAERVLSSDLPAPVIVGSNSYFRPNALATLCFDLSPDGIQEAPFIPLSEVGDDVFSAW